MKKVVSLAVAGAVAGGLVVAAAVPAQAGIQLYQFGTYKTSLGDFGRGTTYVGSKANDKATSLKVSAPAGYAILFQNRDYTGKKSVKFYTGSPNLASYGFDNITSSVG